MDLNREVGEIKAQVKYMAKDLSDIKHDVKTLVAFKERSIGKMVAWSAVAAFVATALIEIAKAGLK